METQERIELDLMASRTTDGKDELNLVEFPLCTLAHRLRSDRKTLQFEDRVWDERRGATVPRQLTITGSDAYGLPTALDDEVLLGLIQLTKLRGFADRKVPFTRYQLIHILGWRNDSKSYERTEESLNRWTGVTLYYQNAWWNKARQCWVNEKFHVLDNVWLCHRVDRAAEVDQAEEHLPLSAFVWNEVVFRSFQAGNLKSIDFDFFKRLDSAIAKRLYRFLDKRFYHRKRWEFDLYELAWEHVGLARGYDTASLKRKLRRGIAELEVKGYLQPMADAERFRKVCSGQWRVTFAQSDSAPPPKEPIACSDEADVLTGALVERGVASAAARETVRIFPPDQIKAQLEVFDWLMAGQDPKVSRNPPGFLVSAIKGDYAPPREFLSYQEQMRRKQTAREHWRRLRARQQAKADREQAEERERETRTQRYWQSLSEEEKSRIEQEALAQAPLFQRKLIDRGGTGGTVARKTVLASYLRKVVETYS